MAKNLDVTLHTNTRHCKEACEDHKRAVDSGDKRAIAATREKLREVVRANTSIVSRSSA